MKIKKLREGKIMKSQLIDFSVHHGFFENQFGKKIKKQNKEQILPK